MDIYDMADNVRSQDDFVSFIKVLLKNLEENPDEWENNDLRSFLSGIEGYCLDKKQTDFTWSTFAKILLAAKVYE